MPHFFLFLFPVTLTFDLDIRQQTEIQSDKQTYPA